MTTLSTDLALHLYGRPLGEAPTLLCLHGLTDSGSGWPDAYSRWGDRFAVVAPDQRGHGASPRFTEEQRAAAPGEVMVEDALTLLAQLGKPPVVIGHSLGGAVALSAAVRRPDQVRALVLEDPAPLGPHEEQPDELRGGEYLAGLGPSLEAADGEALRSARRAAHPWWPESELLVTGRAEQQMDLAYLAAGNWKPTTPWPELVRALAVPTLVVSGDPATHLDELCVDDDMERGLAAIGNGHLRLVRVPGAGHCVRRDQPDRFHEVVDAFLAEVTGS